MLLATLVVVASIYSVVLAGLRLGETHYLVALLNLLAGLFWGFISFVLLIRPFSSLRVTLMALPAWLGTGALLRVFYGIWHGETPSITFGVVLLVISAPLAVLVLHETRPSTRLPRGLAAQAATFLTAPRPSSRLATVTFPDGRRLSNALVLGGGYLHPPRGTTVDARDAVGIAPGGEPTIVGLSDEVTDGSAAVSIVREPAWPVSRGYFEVLFDEASVATIPEGGEVRLEVTPGSHQLEVAIGRLSRSKKVAVVLEPRQTARFACRSKFNPFLRPTGYIRLTRSG